MASTTAVLQQQQPHQKPQKMHQQPDHNIELMCRLCAADFKIATEGVSIFNTEHLMDKINNYLHIQVATSDKLSHLVCNECVRKIDNFHCYALMAQKNQDLFNIMYSEKIYREHCTALSSLNTTLYREPPQPPGQPSVQSTSQPHTITVQQIPPVKKQKIQTQQKPIKVQPQTSAQPKIKQQHQQHLLLQEQQIQQQMQQQQQQQQAVAVLSTEDITIFTYQDLKLGQVIKDLELQKLILRALKWTDGGKTIDEQLERLRNASFRGVMNNPDLLRDEDLVQLLGPYLGHQSTQPEPPKSSSVDYNAKLMDDNVTEMEVSIDPDCFFPYDDDDTKSMDVEMARVVKPKKERKKSESRKQSAKKKATVVAEFQIPSNLAPAVTIVPQPVTPVQSVITSTSTQSTSSMPTGKIRVKSESQLFNTAANIMQSTTIGQTTIIPENVPMPRPVIVIPQPKPKQITSKRKTIDERPSLTIIPEPIITTTAPATATASAPPLAKLPTASVPVTVAVPQPVIQLPLKTNKVTDTNKVAAKNAKAKLEAANTMAALSASMPAIITQTPAAAPPKAKPKKDSKTRTQIRIKLDTGPKTRARSIFSAKHKCAVCNKKFTTSGNLKAHVKTHKPKGKFNCDKCGRVFKSQANLQRHKEYHAGEQFSCRTCGRVYPSNSTLKQHEISHSNFRPHKCNICTKTFKRSQDLKFHTNQHTGAKPYKCPYCSKAFASSGNCFSHRKRVHSDKTPNEPMPITPTSSRKTAALESANRKLAKA